MTGWVKLHRELLSKPIWEASTPEQKTILITLLAMANHKEKEWEWRGQKFKATAGQFVTSLPSLVQKSGKGVSVQNVRTALKRFEKLGFLTDESTNQNRLITIVNWGIYQGKEDDVTSDLTGNQQATNRQLTANKNVRTKEGKKEPIIQQAELFESWWSLYGNKKGKVKCETKYASLLKKYKHEQIMDGTHHYLNHREGLARKGEFVPQQKNPLTFLNGEHFNDEYEGSDHVIHIVQKPQEYVHNMNAGEG